jgi:PPM family protein phosphatase
MELEYSGHSIKGTVHKNNEDSYRLLGNSVPLVKQANYGQIFAVFDGMGSAPQGAQAAQAMSDCLRHFFDSEQEKSATLLQDLLFEGNKAINDWGFIEGTQKALGACAGTISWLYDNKLTLFHAGDTIALLIKDDIERKLTVDHADGHGIYRYFGLGESLLIDSVQFKVEEGDVLVLVSDGVTKVLSEHQSTECVRQHYLFSPERAVKELCRLSKLRGSWDDITAVVVEIIDLDDE